MATAVKKTSRFVYKAPKKKSPKKPSVPSPRSSRKAGGRIMC